jgi:hypothetical protein
MPIEYKVAHGGKLVVEVWSGEITRDLLIDHQKRSLSDESIQPGRIELVDVTRATGAAIGEKELKEFTDYYREHPDRARSVRIAIVASGDGFDKARIFERLSVPHLITVVVFNEIDTACTWLGVDEAEVRSMIREIQSEPASQ